LDRKRKKRTSNKEWKSPTDADARIAKMKDGRTHLAHKAEHAVDLDTGAVVAVTLQAADKGDTTTLDETLCEAGMAVAEQVGREAELRPDEAPKVNVAGIEETVTDKEPLRQACFDPLLTLHVSDKSEGALQKPNVCVRCQVLREIAYPTTSPDLQEIRYLHPGLLASPLNRSGKEARPRHWTFFLIFLYIKTLLQVGVGG
jgi:hypothetical protein